MRIDVFTLVPHVFAAVSEQRPLAAVLGDGLDLRLFNYRDWTPLPGGQVDDEPYGGGAGMVLRVDVVAAALEGVYGGIPEHRVIALTPQGRQLDQRVVEEIAEEDHITLLSARFEGFDERILVRLADDAISIGPYILSGGELPAMVVLDAVARKLPGALGEGSAAEETFSVELERGFEYPHYTRPADFRGWRVPDVLVSGDHARIADWRRARSRGAHAFVRNPIERLTYRLPRSWRIAIDWVVTIVGAVAIVLAIKAWVVNPYRIPSSSMEPTLHCAGGGLGCTARFSDRVLANRFIYHFVDPKRGDIVVFKTPAAARRDCGAGGTFVKRIVGLPGELWEMRNGYVYIDGVRLREPYITEDRRNGDSAPPYRIPEDQYYVMGDNRSSSCDSRVWGALPKENLIGKVFAVYWPPKRVSVHS